MKNESDAWLDEALETLGADDAQVKAPAHLHAAVLGEWDRQHKGHMRRGGGPASANVGSLRDPTKQCWLGGPQLRTAWARSRRSATRTGGRRTLIWSIVSAAAAATLVVVIVRHGSVDPSGSDTMPAVETAAPPESLLTRVPGAPLPADDVEPPLTRRVAGPDRRQPAGERGYVIVPGPLVDPTSRHLVRARMSSRALATLGMPIVNPDADGLVEVEMLVGDDGVAQLIRHAAFVSDQSETGGEQ